MAQRREKGSGSISQRKDGTWTARVVIGTTDKGKPKIKALYGKTEREIRKKLSDYKKEAAKYEYVNIQKDTVENYMTSWLNNNKRNTLKPRSFDRLEQTLKFQVFPHIGHLQLAAVTSNDIQDMINALRDKGNAYSTIKKAYDAVNGCFRLGVNQRTMQFNPAVGVTLPRQDACGEPEIKFYSAEEAKLICDAAVTKFSNGVPIYKMGECIILMLNTGIRMAEMLGLKWSDVDIESNLIRINSTRVIIKDRTGSSGKKNVVIEQNSTKTDSGIRNVTLNSAAKKSLENLKKISGNYTYVLSTEQGKPFSPRSLDRLCRRIMERAGLPEEKIYGLHSLRHTFATLLFEKGVDVKTVSELLGHANVTITYNTYIHIIQKQKIAAAELINIT